MKTIVVVLSLLSMAGVALANEKKTIVITRMRGPSEVCYVMDLGTSENWNCI